MPWCTVLCRVACSTSRANSVIAHIYYSFFITSLWGIQIFIRKCDIGQWSSTFLILWSRTHSHFQTSVEDANSFSKLIMYWSFTKTSGIDLILYCVCYIFKEGTLFCQPDSKNNQLLFMILEHIIVKVQNLIKNYSQGSPGSMMMNFWYLFSNWSRDFWM